MSTEHDLRMAFEPGYEEKWQELELYRDRIRRTMFQTREWLPMLVALIANGVGALLLGMGWITLVVPPIVMTIWVGATLAFIHRRVRMKRKELGID